MFIVPLLQSFSREVEDWPLDTLSLCLAGRGGCRIGAGVAWIFNNSSMSAKVSATSSVVYRQVSSEHGSGFSGSWLGEGEETKLFAITYKSYSS